MDQQMDTAEHLRMHHAQTLWMYWILVILGCWLVLMPTMSIPPTLAVATVAGIALLFAPGIWHIPIGTMAAHVFYITGALIVVCSVISMGEVVRVIRWVNLPAGLTVAVVPWFFDAGRNLGVTGSLIGLLVCLLSVPRGRITETYGLWQKYVH